MVFSGRRSLLAKRVLFASALLSSAYVREGIGLSVDQAVIWFPSGVAVAGLWLLGAREWWVVAACAAGHRLLAGNGAGYAMTAAAGSATEALLGAYLLGKLGFDARLERLRDILALVGAACAAPVASIVASWAGRALLSADPNMALYYFGWWRMNALGIFAIVPPAAIWLAASAEPLEGRRAAFAALMAAGTAVGILLLMRLLPVSVTGVLLLVAVLPISLYAGVRFGPRGAASAGALAAIVVALGTGYGWGPFLSIARSDRHSAVQVFELLLITMPLALGVLVADRMAAERTTAFEARVLGLVAAGRPVAEVFEGIVAGIEELTKGLCSILTLQGGRMDAVMPPAPHHGLTLCWSTPIRDSGGGVLGVFAIYTRERRGPDAGELALAERAAALAGIAVERERRVEALRRSEDLLASINRNVSEGLYRRTSGGDLIYVNLAFARMFGYDSPEAVLAEPDGMRFVDPGRRDEVRSALAEGGRVQNEEVRFRRRDGSDFWGLVSITGVHGEEGFLTHEDGVIADVTARKALEEQFRQSQKMEAVGKLAGGVAHDFNNLLTVVLGHAEDIGVSSAPADPVRAHAREIESAARRGAGLTRQLLAYSRQQLLRPQVLDLTEVVDELGGMLRRLIGEDVRLVTRHVSGRLWVRVDKSQLEQVIVNLAVNARDAMPSGGMLRIETSAADVGEAEAGADADLPSGAYAVLSVQDTGTGMSPEVRGRAFDPFFTTKGPGQGSGLGLSTVLGIVKQSGGAVRLESAVGSGTVAWIHLPRIDEPPIEPKEIPVEASACPVERTVLLAEDEPAVRMMVREALVRGGFRVLEAEDGEEGLAVSRAHGGAVDLLVTDIVMPNLGGRELAARLLVERPGLRVLFMSGYSNDARELGELVGSTGDLLRKPFSLRELVERARAALPPREDVTSAASSAG
ncbi:MAG: MASE1 domain-containing protein [Holophagales bacterium]|nr:MASE1 domain-containing protein [Holophagales bacterium]